MPSKQYSVHARATYLAVGSPQTAVVDDKRGVVLLNGRVEPLYQVGRCLRAGFWFSTLFSSSLFSGSLLLLRRRFLMFLRRRFLVLCDLLLLECSHRTRFSRVVSTSRSSDFIVSWAGPNALNRTGAPMQQNGMGLRNSAARVSFFTARTIAPTRPCSPIG